LVHHYNYSVSELEKMIPWEREVYITLLKDYLEKEAEERRKNS
tara:strand:+ start:437 stop:565 length:129 start_codon:yes stop_codon:yes gene_type:complete